MDLDLDGINIQIIKKPIKSIRLKIHPPDGTVKMSIPSRIAMSVVHDFLRQHQHWIKEQQFKVKQRSLHDDPLITHGAMIPFQGLLHQLNLIEHHGPTRVYLKEGQLYAYTKPDLTQEQLKSILERWYRQQMLAVLPTIISTWEQRIGVSVHDWGVKKMRSRWGSCNNKARRIWLNLNLITKKPVCLEYVVVHELVHLLEPSHNKRFHALMTQFMPQWPEYKMMLEKGY